MPVGGAAGDHYAEDPVVEAGGVPGFQSGEVFVLVEGVEVVGEGVGDEFAFGDQGEEGGDGGEGRFEESVLVLVAEADGFEMGKGGIVAGEERGAQEVLGGGEGGEGGFGLGGHV